MFSSVLVRIFVRRFVQAVLEEAVEEISAADSLRLELGSGDFAPRRKGSDV